MACDPDSVDDRSPSPPPPPLIQRPRDVREMLHRAVRSGDVRDIEKAIGRINYELSREREAGRPG